MICNKCGADCDIAVSTHDPPLKNCCGATYRYLGCYGSYMLKDMTRYEFSLCEKCLALLFKTFKIPPTEDRP